MKFVCLNCETYMNFEKVEKPGEGSLGVFFGCPSCGAKFSMVTNPGETQMVSSLGVKLGGRTAAAEPFEMTRGTLKDEALAGAGQMGAYLNEKIQGGQPVSPPAIAPAKAGEKTSSGCPFSAMVAEMGLTTGGKPGNGTAPIISDYTWTADAKEKLDRLPAFVKPMVQSSVEAYARKNGFKAITLHVMDDSKNDSPNGMTWSREAEQRLENIPDFIRPMARKEIERLAKEQGVATITAQVMDDATDNYMKFMLPLRHATDFPEADPAPRMGLSIIDPVRSTIPSLEDLILGDLPGSLTDRSSFWVKPVTAQDHSGEHGASHEVAFTNDYHRASALVGVWEGSAEGIAYSEFNHRLAGLFILLIGFSELS